MIPRIWRKEIGSDEKLPFTEHLEELRHRLIIIAIGIGVGFAASYGFAEKILYFLQRPLQRASPSELPTRLVFIAPTEAFFVNLKAAFFAGIFFSAPLILFQVWKFVAPGLYEHERKYTFPFLLASSVLFVVGASFAYLVILPIVLHFLITQGGDLWKPNITLSNYLSFCMKLILAAGLIFEFPVFMYFLSKIGVVTPAFLVKNRRYALLAAFVLAAVLSPGDAPSLFLLAIPLYLLFEASIFVAKRLAAGQDAAGTQGNE